MIFSEIGPNEFDKWGGLVYFSKNEKIYPVNDGSGTLARNQKFI